MSAGFTPAPWVPTYFTRADGSPIETVEHVAETTAHSAREGTGTTLHGVTLTGEDDGVVVCYTGNGPTSEANASLIAQAPKLYELAAKIDAMWSEHLEPGEGPEAARSGEVREIWHELRAALAKVQS